VTATNGKVHAYIDEHWDEHLDAVRDFVRQPSISADGTGMAECARMLVRWIERLGGTGEVVPTEGWPVVYGRIDAGARHTILLYGMYDVQPVLGETWVVGDPFGGEIMVPPFAPELGPCLINRGVMNQKGPLVNTLLALEALKKVNGTLPLNVIFMVEGEEEMGSKHLPDFVAANRDRLKADAAFFAFLSQDMNGKVLSYLGVKGILFMEFTARGGEWGGPTVRAVHGSNAVWYGNPAWRLAHALSSMITTDQKHILIDGFYDEVEPADAHDEALLAALAPTLDPDEQLQSDDVRRFKYDLDGVPLLRKYLYQPTLNIDGIVGGHWQEGTKTIIPHEAKAKMDVRMVRNMDPARTFERIRAHLDTHGFADIEVEILDSYKWSKTRLDDAPVGAMVDTYRQFGHEPEIWPHLAGSAPFYLFTDKDWLNIPVAMGGLGHGGRVHSPNEYATVQGLKESQQWIAAYFLNLADALAEK
jgi:acetylornithine deacetylase/succinyl-diaminopimelate desuccinylase-like protein